MKEMWWTSLRQVSTGQAAASWGGHVQAPLFDGPDWTEVTRIRLENGSEGEVDLEEEASWTIDLQPVHEGTLRTAAVTGSGTAPF